MRISTNSIYQTAVSKINSLQAEQSKLQQQIATGKRLLTPSDDPLASARVLQLSQSQSVNTQFGENRKVAETRLGDLDISLGSITELLTTVRTTLVGSAGTLSTGQRNALAIQLGSSMETLLGLANTRDAAGNYLYAGFQNKAIPFTATATGATYNGDSNQQLLQVDTHRQMTVNASGNSVFQAGGNDIFSTLSTLITLLNNTAATASTVTTGVATALSSVDSAISNVAVIRSTVGSRLNEIDSLNDVGASRELQYAQAMSALQDLDYAKALSDVSQKQSILEAAQKSFVTTTGLSLFNFIK